MRTVSGLTTVVMLCAGLGVGPAVAAAQGTAPSGPIKLAFIRSQDIFAQTPGRAEAESQFNKDVENARAQEKAMGDSMSALVTQYSNAESTLSPDARATRQQSLRERQAQFQQRQQQIEQQIQQRQQQLVQPILERINGVINQIRAENGYTMVFDAQATGGGLVAADKAYDITDAVIERLKAAGPVATTPGVGGGVKPASRPATGPTAAPSGVSRPKNPS